MPDKPHLIVLLKGYPRLSETFIAQELRGLEKAGFRLSLVSLRHPTDKKRHPVHDEIEAPVMYLPEYLHEEPLRVLSALGKALLNRRFWALMPRFLKDLARDVSRNRVRRLGQAAVLVAEWPEGGEWLHAHFIHTPCSVAAYASAMTAVPYTVSAHAKDIWTSPDWELAEKLARARWTVTCTASGYEHLKHLAAGRGPVHLSYHGLNLSRFAHFEGPRPSRDGSDPADPVRLISVGRAVEKKGYDILLKALSLLPKDIHWRFDHIGGGGELEKLKPLAESLGLSDRIAWKGALDQLEVLDHYRRSDLFALACRITADGDRDGLPNVIVEASSQGLATVSTNISGIPELLTDGENGFLVEPESPEAFAGALEKAIRNPALRQAYGDRVEQKVRASFDYHVSIRELSTLFETAWAEWRR
ncbi:glycosyltransferase [Gellertiella hungarica]|uniref:Glycosyltransferase involved in cell wall biosynthesis n=1 Tax=Gellertiella hungarica TaxID=1572859 RepID=A0A7W6NJF3_9HYPH|nr:glycosyltransferase [Gellertiella hungarica]MBB4063247.1 glycosyltransferase involved in cell wall biosynthesis [Gellertiella hungarica]